MVGEITLEHPERSSYIFTLAEEAGIPLRPGEQDALEDKVFLQFGRRYQLWAGSRDKALSAYLSRTPNLFRCYLPYSPRVFQVAYQILWYLDEIVVRDPIAVSLDRPDTGDHENAKVNLRETLQLLYRFRQSIDSGYLLLGGSNLIPSLGDSASPQIKHILAQPELVTELDQAVRFGLDKRYDDQGREWIVYDAQLDAGGILGLYVPGGISGSATSPAIVIGETLPLSSHSELGAILGQDIYEQVHRLYPREVHRTLHAVGVATSFGAAVLFDRPVDTTIVNVAKNVAIDSARQAATVTSLNLALPYLEGVPADRLLDLRAAVPEAFREFRARIVDIVSRAMKEDPEKAPQMAQLAADRELLSSLRTLQSEMEAASKKARILGYGLPAISVSGALIGASMGVNIEWLLSMLLPSGAGVLKVVADFFSEQKRAQTNPFYFLWRAKHG